MRRVRRGDQILEVGYGRSKTVIAKTRKAQARWWGIDARRIPRRNGYKALVTDIPFEDDSFDGCFALSTIEHWREHGCLPEEGMREIHRVLKPGAWLAITLPYHIHGGYEFIAGVTEKTLSYFDSKLWTLDIEEWRKDYKPLQQYLGWIGPSGRRSDMIVRECSTQAVPSSWTHMIVATKKP
jgi:SAM-dependent methyltransferase